MYITVPRLEKKQSLFGFRANRYIGSIHVRCDSLFQPPKLIHFSKAKLYPLASVAIGVSRGNNSLRRRSVRRQMLG